MSFNICENGHLACTRVKTVITWNKWSDDILEMPANSGSSSRELMKLTADDKINLDIKTYQLQHTFRKLVLFL
jgi:hypothetical protein